jgi:hypothetical protein
MSYVPYQIDYQVKGAGKTLGLTKKKVCFQGTRCLEIGAMDCGFGRLTTLCDRLPLSLALPMTRHSQMAFLVRIVVDQNMKSSSSGP